MSFKSMRGPVVVVAAAALVLTACGEGEDPREPSTAEESGDTQTLTIESWRTEDSALWTEQIIPAFTAEHPDIEVSFNPTKNTEYNAALNSRLAGGTAGDLITCRPFDLSDALYADGHLAPLDDLEGLDNFPELALSAWADDGTSYCVPMASVIHGFYYNKAIFDELGIEEPATHAEFLDVLQTIKENGEYAPLAWGTADNWIASQTAFTNIGPSYWNGEEGRQGVISGEMSFTDPQFVAAWEALEDWQPYFPDGYQGIAYPDTQQLFSLGRAAVFPGGSWEISLFQDAADFEIGVFPPPVPEAGDQCYISDHTDIAMGINAASDNKEAARTFLEWISGSEFASIYANELPGFFPLTEEEITVENELAQEFLSFRDDCESTVRVTDEKLSAEEPNTENQVRELTAQMWNGELTPEEVASEVQNGLSSWYEPQQD